MQCEVSPKETSNDLSSDDEMDILHLETATSYMSTRARMGCLRIDTRVRVGYIGLEAQGHSQLQRPGGWRAFLHL